MKRNVFRAIVSSAAVVALIGFPAASPSFAESNEVRFSQQFGLLYLPLHVVVGEKLVQKHAKKAGLGEIKVSMVALSGGAASNQALLSGNVEFAAAGIGPLLTIWDRTKGSADVKAAVDIAKMPLKLITNDANVKTVEDYLKVSDHKIATPSISSIQAVTLRMELVKKWGDASAKKLDPLLVNMKHPDAVAAILTGGQTVKSHFATLPFSYQLLKSGKTSVVLNSFSVLGGQHSTVALYGTTKWKNENPKLYKAVVDAYAEAMQYINADLARAAKYFVTFTKSKLKLEDVKGMISSKDEIEYSLDPKRTMEYARFMHKIGAIKNLPASWKDYYHDNNHALGGS
ncbi:MAG TPA: ABC transporter substrate-binding protein [Burkholderiales bacterium]|nr:ABC transporter substrate-binding protein [Burkholderiales bacterium]